MTEKILKDLELVEVAYDDTKATLTFIDRDAGEVREVNFNKKVYDRENNKWISNDEKAQKVEEQVQEFFNTSFDKLNDAVGTKHDIYAYDTFNSMQHIDQVEKFKKEQNGKVYQDVVVKEIFDDGIAIRIRYDIDGNTYETKYTYAKYMEATKEWFPNPQEKTKKYKKFKDTFGVLFEENDSIIGKEIMVKVNNAFGKFYYGEIMQLG
ncbi:hypothetical protein [Lactobacillus terrae]|uniref:hypothetical protein n=1 Tax=Lactobacillus terrae TaxID=2269374 RepID=UPI000C1B76F9|nr:hypothetical protein [Lactobacillus terrae]